MSKRIVLQPKDKLPRFYLLVVSRIQIIDKITNIDYLLEGYKIYAHTLILTDSGNIIDVYMIGMPESGLVPYFDVIMEIAHDFESGNINCVIVNKGDNPVEVKVDGYSIGITETIDQSMVHYSNETAYIAKKWLSFNFKEV